MIDCVDNGELAVEQHLKIFEKSKIDLKYLIFKTPERGQCETKFANV